MEKPFKLFKIASLIIYFVSFCLPVFNGEESVGALAFFVGALTHTGPWMANVFYIIALAMKRKLHNERLICIVIAIGLACITFSIHEIGQIGSESEPAKVTPGLGFYFWFSSFILLFISILLGKYDDSRVSKKLPPPIS